MRWRSRFSGGKEASALRELRQRFGLEPHQTLAVGDGANDLAMLGEAGLGVAFHAKPAVAAAAHARIEHADLTALLYAQGRAEDIVGVTPQLLSPTGSAIASQLSPAAMRHDRPVGPVASRVQEPFRETRSSITRPDWAKPTPMGASLYC